MGEARRRELTAINGIQAVEAGEPSDQVEPVEQVAPEDLPYLLQVRSQLGEIEQIQQQVAQLQAQIAGLVGAHDSYVAFLAERYGLDINRDRIMEDGAIVRADAQTAPQRA